MLEDVLPERICKALRNISYSSLCELRLRADNPIIVNCLGENYYLADDKLTKSTDGALSVSMGIMQSTIQKLTKQQLKHQIPQKVL